ncbi:hypothetical protein TcWFU_010235, partial [Taenia crassiceps]
LPNCLGGRRRAVETALRVSVGWGAVAVVEWSHERRSGGKANAWTKDRLHAANQAWRQQPYPDPCESTDYHPHQHKPHLPPPSLPPSLPPLPLTQPSQSSLRTPIPLHPHYPALVTRHPPPAFRREHCQLCHNGDATTEEEKMIVFKMYIACRNIRQ